MSGRFVGIWAAAPQPTEPPDLPPPFTRDGLVLPDSTLRQTIRVSAGAQRVRLRLSNAFGGTDLCVASVCLARPAGGRAGVSGIEPGTSRALTFAGRPGVVVPAGAQAVSDPIDFPLAAAANVTVTTYLAAGQRAAGGITSHPGSRTTSFLVAGDHAADQRLAGAVPVDHWYFLGALEACSGPATAAAVILGDSLTDGRGSTTNGNDRWPDQLVDLLRSRGDGAGTAVLNQGIGGNRVLRDGLGPSIVSRLDRDVLAVNGVGWLVVFAGVNDIGAADATQAAQRQVAAELCTAYEVIAAKAHTAGIAVYGATLTPFARQRPVRRPRRAPRGRPPGRQRLDPRQRPVRRRPRLRPGGTRPACSSAAQRRGGQRRPPAPQPGGQPGARERRARRLVPAAHPRRTSVEARLIWTECLQ